MFAGTAGGPEEHSAQHGHLARGKQMHLTIRLLELLEALMD